MSRGFCIFLGILLLAGGLALVGINGWTTWEQGAKWAVTEQGKLIIAITVVAIEVIGVVIVGFCGGAALGARRWVMGTILTVMMLASAVVVANSIASFQATERISSSKTHELRADRVATADKLAKQAAEKTLEAATGSRRTTARRDYIGANQAAIKDFRQLPTEVVVEVEASARLWSWLFGLSVQDVQLGQAGYTAILQIMLSMVCIHAAGYFLSPAWARAAKPAENKAQDKPPESGSSHGGSSGSGGRETFKPTIVHPEPPKPEPLRAIDGGLPKFEPLRERLAQLDLPKPNGSASSKPTTLKIEPPKVSSALAGVTEPSVPPKEWSREEVKDLLRRQRDGKAPKESSYQIADKTGVPQRTISRWQKRLYGQTNTRNRRYAGNGGGFHATVN